MVDFIVDKLIYYQLCFNNNATAIRLSDSFLGRKNCQRDSVSVDCVVDVVDTLVVGFVSREVACERQAYFEMFVIRWN